jgi:hypothetical protein
VQLIEPPVDVLANHPGIATDAFRRHFGLHERSLPSTGERIVDIGVVCRLVPQLKLEGLLTAVDAVGALAVERPVRLVISGDGPARAQVEERAARANARAGRRAVVLTGLLPDPRPAYAAADIMIGMGGSALRALAFERPLIVQGEAGFWKLLTPETVATFLHQGWYGIGNGLDGLQRLTGILVPLLEAPALRASLGRYGRQLAVDRFSLQAAARVQEDVYRRAVAERPALDPATLAAMMRSLWGLSAHKLRGRWQRLRGTERRDDFNTTALAAAAMRPSPAAF